MMFVFRKTAVCMLLALPAVAQSPSFTTITIKPARSSDARDARMQVRPDGDLIASGVPVIRLLSYAYDVPVNPSPRLSLQPEWTLRETYDIEAKAGANAIPPGLQDREVRSRIQQMIRGLLAEIALADNERAEQEGFYLTLFAVNSLAAGPNTGGRPFSDW